jgi:tRNA pseudouridine55 synthase
MEGLLLVDKPQGKTSFSLIARLRRILNVKTIGHAGTLDPMATGLMILLIGKSYTKQASSFLDYDKAYDAQITLGVTTDTYDAEGEMVASSDKIPTLEEILSLLPRFNGAQMQVPPMFSAKKQNGKKLYELARKGIEVVRPPVQVHLNTKLTSYAPPLLNLSINCSKGTYIRSIAHDLGQLLGSGGHLSGLVRTRVGPYRLSDALPGSWLFDLEIEEAYVKLKYAIK